MKGFKIASLNIDNFFETCWCFDWHYLISKLMFLLSNRQWNSCLRYNMRRRYCNRFWGWVVIYVRKDHSLYKWKGLNLESLEVICIEIWKQRSRPTLTSAYHRAPNSEMKILHSLKYFSINVMLKVWNCLYHWWH